MKRISLGTTGKTWCIMVIALLSRVTVFGQPTNLAISTHVANDRFRNPAIAVNPTDDANLVVAVHNHNITSPTDKIVYYYRYSTNGGTAWGGNINILADVTGTDNSYDSNRVPSVTFSREGTAYIGFSSYKTRLDNEIRIKAQNGVFLRYSTDKGVSWQPAASTISAVKNTSPTTNIFDDEPTIAADATAGVNSGNVYAVWTRKYNVGSETKIYFSRLTNGANAFDAPVQVSGTGSDLILKGGPSVAVAANGIIDVAWLKDGNTLAWRGSGNGGTTFGTEHSFYTNIQQVTTVKNGLVAANSYPSIAADADPTSPFYRNVYFVWTDGRTGNPDIFFTRGTHLTADLAVLPAPKRINDDPVGTPHDQWAPRVTVAPDGTIYVVFYDSRADDSKVDIYVAASVDGGESFTQSKVNTGTWTAFNIDNLAEYIGITSVSGTAYPIWRDARSFPPDVYMAELQTKIVTVDQKLESGARVGDVYRWNGVAFKGFWTGASPYLYDFSFYPNKKFVFPIYAPSGYSAVFRGDQDVWNGGKYNNWNNLPDVRNHHVFEITQSSPATLISNLKPTNSGITIKNELLDVPGTDAGGTVGFRDPWLIDYQDPLYNNSLRNRGHDPAIWHDGLTSPFNPNTNFPFAGSEYQGVFLNQPFDGPNPVYYSVRTPYTIDIFGKSTFVLLGFISYFQGWMSDGASFQNPNYIETPVVFTSAHPVRARYKAHLGTSTAVEFSNQRKVARGYLSQPHAMTYESAGDIWYSNSWDGVSNWSREELVSRGDGKCCHPSVEQVYWPIGMTTYSKTQVVWEENPVNGTGYRIWARKRDEPNGAWGSPILLHEDLTARPSAALPTISGTIVCWRGPNSLLYRDILVEPPLPVQTIAGTDQNSAFQAVDVYLGYSYFVWEQTGVGINPSSTVGK